MGQSWPRTLELSRDESASAKDPPPLVVPTRSATGRESCFAELFCDSTRPTKGNSIFAVRNKGRQATPRPPRPNACRSAASWSRRQLPSHCWRRLLGGPSRAEDIWITLSGCLYLGFSTDPVGYFSVRFNAAVVTVVAVCDNDVPIRCIERPRDRALNASFVTRGIRGRAAGQYPESLRKTPLSNGAVFRDHIISHPRPGVTARSHCARCRPAPSSGNGGGFPTTGDNGCSVRRSE